MADPFTISGAEAAGMARPLVDGKTYGLASDPWATIRPISASIWRYGAYGLARHRAQGRERG